MQEGDVGASNSDLLSDKAADDGKHMSERFVELEYKLSKSLVAEREFEKKF